MNPLCRYSIRYPVSVLVMGAVVTLAIAPGVTRLTLRTDGHALVPTGAPEIEADRSVRDRFGVLDPIVVVIETEDPRGVYNLRTLATVRDLTRALTDLDGIEPWTVTSLATEKTDRVYPGTLRFRPLLDPFPANDDDLDRIRGDVRAIELYTGTVVSADERAAAVFVGIPDDMARSELLDRVRKIIGEAKNDHDRILVIGAPVAEALLGTHLLEDLGVPSAILGRSVERDPQTLPVGLVPLAIAVIGVVFWIRFRSVVAVALPLSEVGACLLLVFACMGWSGVPIYLTTAVLPVILTVAGIADEIHIFHRYRETLSDRPEACHREAVQTTMEEMWLPVTKTSVTTAVGFLSFALSPIAPVRAFGFFTALGILFCMVWSLTIIPALLTLIEPRRLMPASARIPRRADTVSARSSRLLNLVTRRRAAIIAGACCIVALTPIGLSRLIVQDSWIDGFAEDTPFRRAMQSFNDRFLGMHTLLISVDTDDKPYAGTLSATDLDHNRARIEAAGITDPSSLVHWRMQLLPIAPQAALTTPEAGRARIPPEWSGRIERVTRDGDALELTIARRAGSPKLAARQWRTDSLRYTITAQRYKQPMWLHRVADFEAFLRAQTDSQVGGALGPASYIATASFMEQARRPGSRSIPADPDHVERLWRRYSQIKGEQGLRQVVDPEYSAGLVSVFLKNANFRDTHRLMDRICDYERDTLAAHGVTLTFSGDVAVSQALIRGIVTTQIQSLLLSLGGILLLTTLLSRSVQTGVLCTLPCAVAVLVNFAVMGWLGIPLGVATSMFAGMTLGIGVDYAIHLLERLRFARERGLDSGASLADAVTATAPAITLDALAVALGFGLMTMSQVPANARLGALLVLSIATCLAATLLLIPAILSNSRHRFGEADAMAIR